MWLDITRRLHPAIPLYAHVQIHLLCSAQFSSSFSAMLCPKGNDISCYETNFINLCWQQNLYAFILIQNTKELVYDKSFCLLCNHKYKCIVVTMNCDTYYTWRKDK